MKTAKKRLSEEGEFCVDLGTTIVLRLTLHARYEEESGIRIEPFNTVFLNPALCLSTLNIDKQDMEREEGHFDAASGHYVEDKFKMSQVYV